MIHFMPQQSPSEKRIPSLDGLRAVSIGLVLVSHLFGTQNFFGRNAIPFVGNLGKLGVHCFFIISGYLISRLLLEELESSGRISLRRFYLRRTLRIFPAFYTYVAIIALLNIRGLFHIPSAEFLLASTYTINYQQWGPGSSWELGHVWSLCVEEQFYLIWPLLLVILGRKKALASMFIIVLIVPLIRYGTWRYFPSHYSQTKYEFQGVCDALATGCLLAGLQPWLDRRIEVSKLLQSPLVFLCPLIALVVSAHSVGKPRFVSLIGLPVTHLTLALYLYRAIRFPHKGECRLLNTKPLVFIGVLSYSLYLWQEPFTNRLSKSLLCAFPVNVSLAFCAALASYVLVERPALAFRKKLERRFFEMGQLRWLSLLRRRSRLAG